jgi:hypothetical protein
MQRHKPQDALFVDENKLDEYTQGIHVYEGLPLIARLNQCCKAKKDKEQMHSSLDLCNNEYFTVKRIYQSNDLTKVVCVSTRYDDDNLPFEHEFVVPIHEIQKYFLVNYCSTVYKAQGETLSQDYTIWDWESMNINLKYTAMSRAKLPSQINFKAYGKKDVVSYRVIMNKIKGHELSDQLKGFKTDIDVEYVRDMIAQQCSTCHHCQCDLKLGGFCSGDPSQFSIDRIDDDKGHIQGNVHISCWGCNRAHRNKTS